jgi:glucose/arabinose dehydrogenase
LPAEELVELRQGADYGWPECYFDNQERKLVLGPEYGGDGGKKIGICAERQEPVAFFPAHWAPNDMKIYLGNAFPKAYQGGAFIAFQGSRAARRLQHRVPAACRPVKQPTPMSSLPMALPAP